MVEMSFSDVGMMASLLAIPGFIVIGFGTVMFGRVFVMLGRFVVMLFGMRGDGFSFGE
jgi:hypothetical protein